MFDTADVAGARIAQAGELGPLLRLAGQLLGWEAAPDRAEPPRVADYPRRPAADRAGAGAGPEGASASAAGPGSQEEPPGGVDAIDAQVAALLDASERLGGLRDAVEWAQAVISHRLVRVVGCGLAGRDPDVEREATPCREEAVRQAAGLLQASSSARSGAVRRQVGESCVLVEELPQTALAWGAGRVDATRARILTDVVGEAHGKVQDAVQQQMLSAAGAALPVRRFRRRAEAVAQLADPHEATRLAAQAREGRFVSHPRPAGPGMSRMSMLLPQVDAQIVESTLEGAVAAAKLEGDSRTAAQVRADAVAGMAATAWRTGSLGRPPMPQDADSDLSPHLAPVRAALEAGHLPDCGPGAPLRVGTRCRVTTPRDRVAHARAQIAVVVPADMLIAANAVLTAQNQKDVHAEEPPDPLLRVEPPPGRECDLPTPLLDLGSLAQREDAGRGGAPPRDDESPPEARVPHSLGGRVLDPALALALAGSGTWRRLLADVRGTALDIGRARHDPPPALADLVRLRDRTCVFPGCAVPADRCHLDHTVAWDVGGSTSFGNLACLCPAHHGLKHSRNWTLAQPRPGHLVWTHASGRTFHVRADGRAHPPMSRHESDGHEARGTGGSGSNPGENSE